MMRSAALALFALTAACVNVSQPRSRQATEDQLVPVPPPSAAVTAPPVAPTQHAPDVAEVEVVPVAGSKLGRARATMLVRAPPAQVRAVLFDFPSYPDFLPNYRSAQVESKKPDGTLVVRMEITGLGGMIRRWMRVEVPPSVVSGARETVEAKLIKGDVRAFEARWILEQVPEGTRLTLESFLDPKLEMPAAFVDAGSASGLKDSILAIKARAEEGAR